MYRRLQDAIDNVADNVIVIAEDVTKNGQKQFRVDTVENLHRLYTTIKQPHWYECLLENRPSRIFLDVESMQPVDLDTILKYLAEAIRQKFNIEASIQVLDSCSDTKYSWHVIVENVYLKNVYHVGAFVRRLVLATHEPAIDTAVYTKNRMFRIAGSSKFGSNRVLRHGSKWHRLLVQNVSSSYMECMEIDGSEPLSSSQSPFDLFVRTENGWICQARRTLSTCITTTCSMLEPILQRLDQMTDGGIYRHKCRLTGTGMYLVATKSKKCAIANRTHKGNNIWFMINLSTKRVVQRCHDAECANKSHELCIEPELWSQWHNAWSVIVRTPKNENTLYNIAN